MKERWKSLRIVQFVPFFAALLCAVATVVVCVTVPRFRENAMLFAVMASSLAPLVFPLYYLFTGKDLPVFVWVSVTLHVVCAADLGTGLHVYDTLPWWDLFCHGYFGFNACLAVFVILVNAKNVRMHFAVAVLLAFCVTMALGALWEITEYITDNIMGTDAQRVAESIAAGKSPLADTMEDLMITVAGCAVFAVWWGIDTLCHRRLFTALRLIPEASAAPMRVDCSAEDTANETSVSAPPRE